MARTIYGVSSRYSFGMWNHRVYKFANKASAEKWLHTEEYDFRIRELMSKTAAMKLAGNRAVLNAEEITYEVPEDSIPVTDEALKNEIIEYAMRKIGASGIGFLDYSTVEYKDRYYNIYVENGEATIEEV